MCFDIEMKSLSSIYPFLYTFCLESPFPLQGRILQIEAEVTFLASKSRILLTFPTAKLAQDSRSQEG